MLMKTNIYSIKKNDKYHFKKLKDYLKNYDQGIQ